MVPDPVTVTAGEVAAAVMVGDTVAGADILLVEVIV